MTVLMRIVPFVRLAYTEMGKHSCRAGWGLQGMVLLMLIMRLMWSLTAQRRLAVITLTLTKVRCSFFPTGFSRCMMR